MGQVTTEFPGEEEFMQVFDTWVERLELSEWRFDISFGYASEDYAEIQCAPHYKSAEIRIAASLPKWTREELNLTIVHELYHTFTQPTLVAVDSIENEVGSVAWSLFRDRLTHEEEHLVDRLATQAVAKLGEV